jgi:hypothetical protein
MSQRSKNFVRLGLPVVEVVLGTVLLYSGVTHLQNPYAFLDAVGGYRLVPLEGLVPVTILLLAAHLTVGIALICRFLQPGVYVVAATLFGLFVTAQVSAFTRGLDVSCGCLGSSSETIGPLTIARTSAMFAISLLAWYVASPQTRPKIHRAVRLSDDEWTALSAVSADQSLEP